MRALLHRLGLRTREQGAWGFYDWANSAFVTSIVATLYPIYFVKVAAADLPNGVATGRFAAATAVSLAIIAVLGPVLGAVADCGGLRKRLLGLFAAIGIAGTAALGFVGEGDWLLGAVLFVIANLGASGSFVFYDALLPHVARPEETDRVSAAGYALGYIGGGTLLAAHLVVVSRPELVGFADRGMATRAAFVSVAVWWALFSIPLFTTVREPTGHSTRLRVGLVTDAFRSLAGTFREIRRYRDAFVFLCAFLVYNDGVGTIIRMAAAYGTEIGIPETSLIGAILMVQFIGAPAALVLGRVAGRVGTRRVLFGCLAVYVVITLVGFFMRTAAHFFLLAALVGSVQGALQALSRSFFSRLIPADRSGEFFGFFGVVGRFAAVLGPTLFAVTASRFGSSRGAILAVAAFFIVGGLLLTRVRGGEIDRPA